ncbi:MAG: hypothetical protein MMC33_004732 [Icmadophila ericetorum]|nr:hypothetical protein [Icmadophila ericetorum]
MEESKKRKLEVDAEDGGGKKSKGPRKWKVVPKKTDFASASPSASTVEPGDSGIWATCSMHKEAKCIAELRDIFNEYTEKLYGHELVNATTAETEEKERDIESNIKEEIEVMQTPTAAELFQPVRVDIKCVVFFKTKAPVDPAAFVHSICKDCLAAANTKKSRWTQRLTPMTLIGKATEKGLEEVSKAVLAPHFHQDGAISKKFAIRTTIRNHGSLTRDIVIKQVADTVGPPHTVDLKNYDLLILVEIYRSLGFQNICGMSVVGSDFDRLKRYNLAEIYEPISETK